MLNARQQQVTYITALNTTITERKVIGFTNPLTAPGSSWHWASWVIQNFKACWTVCQR